MSQRSFFTLPATAVAKHDDANSISKLPATAAAQHLDRNSWYASQHIIGSRYVPVMSLQLSMNQHRVVQQPPVL
jgi:hypothetical protein